MFDKLVIFFAEYFLKLKSEGKDEWLIIKSTVACGVLNETYRKFIFDGIPPIEKLTQEKKLFYYTLVCKYYEDTEQIIKASKAAYVLELITNND
jgi:hypothetical protein